MNGRYHLHDTFGKGGMGIVHRAIDRLTGETVAKQSERQAMASTIASEARRETE